MAAASCIHPSHKEFGVISRHVVGFFDCVAQAEVMAWWTVLLDLGV